MGRRPAHTEGSWEYKVFWKGWLKKHATWEPEENILDETLIRMFDSRYPRPACERPNLTVKGRRRQTVVWRERKVRAGDDSLGGGGASKSVVRESVSCVSTSGEQGKPERGSERVENWVRKIEVEIEGFRFWVCHGPRGLGLFAAENIPARTSLGRYWGVRAPITRRSRWAAQAGTAKKPWAVDGDPALETEVMGGVSVGARGYALMALCNEPLPCERVNVRLVRGRDGWPRVTVVDPLGIETGTEVLIFYNDEEFPRDYEHDCDLSLCHAPREERTAAGERRAREARVRRGGGVVKRLTGTAIFVEPSGPPPTN